MSKEMISRIYNQYKACVERAYIDMQDGNDKHAAYYTGKAVALYDLIPDEYWEDFPFDLRENDLHGKYAI